MSLHHLQRTSSHLCRARGRGPCGGRPCSGVRQTPAVAATYIHNWNHPPPHKEICYMFESLTQRLENVFDRLRGRGRITEKDVEEAMREVRQALLEADVNFRLVKQFVKNVQERAVGAEVLQSLSPAQQVIGIVHDELVKMLGGEDAGKTQIQF